MCHAIMATGAKNLAAICLIPRAALRARFEL
jgi:hypothetical protein